MQRTLIALCVFVASTLAAADGSHATPLRSGVDVAVRATTDAGIFEVKAVITDLADDAVLASPVLLVRDGEEGSVRIDRGEQGDLALSVRVDGAGRELRWRSEVRVDGTLVSRQSARIALP